MVFVCSFLIVVLNQGLVLISRKMTACTSSVLLGLWRYNSTFFTIVHQFLRSLYQKFFLAPPVSLFYKHLSYLVKHYNGQVPFDRIIHLYFNHCAVSYHHMENIIIPYRLYYHFKCLGSIRFLIYLFTYNYKIYIYYMLMRAAFRWSKMQ